MHPLLHTLSEGQLPSWEQICSDFGNACPLLHQLEDTPQDAEWHGEGNVAIHTHMVLEQTFLRLEQEASHLSEERRLALILGALFHDIAKPLTTRTKEIDGRDRIVAPRHAERGRNAIAFKIMSWGLSYTVVRQVLALIGHHHDPRWLVLKDKPNHKYAALARQADLELLYHLEQADLRGRICPDLEGQLDDLELFRMQSEEAGTWNANPLASWRDPIEETFHKESQAFREMVFHSGVRAYEMGLIHTPGEAVARGYRFQKGFGELVLLCGPSGCGKSTWAKQHLPDYEVLSLDDIRAEITGDATNQSANSRVRQVARERLKPLLQHHKQVVWDATNLRHDFRRAVIQLGYDYGALVTLVVFHATEETCHQRNAQRQRVVPTKILQHQLEHTEWPTVNEAHRTLFIGDNGLPIHATFDTHTLSHSLSNETNQ